MSRIGFAENKVEPRLEQIGTGNRQAKIPAGPELAQSLQNQSGTVLAAGGDEFILLKTDLLPKLNGPGEKLGQSPLQQFEYRSFNIGGEIEPDNPLHSRKIRVRPGYTSR